MPAGGQNVLNLTGQRFGKLVVIKKVESKNKQSRWLCQCDCGNTKIAVGVQLKRGRIKSCGCLIAQKNKKNNFKDITGQRFGKLVAIKPIGMTSNRNTIWLCQCDCGNQKEVRGDQLRDNSVQSCGCIGRSKGEIKISSLLDKYSIPYEKEKTFQNCIFPDTKRKAKFDFYVNNSYIIEFDGSQHFFFNNSGWNTEENFLKTQKHDLIKNKWCKDNNIPLIRIPYFQFDKINIQDLQPETSNFIVN